MATTDIILKSLLIRYYKNHYLTPSEVRYLIKNSTKANMIAKKLNGKLSK